MNTIEENLEKALDGAFRNSIKCKKFWNKLFSVIIKEIKNLK